MFALRRSLCISAYQRCLQSKCINHVGARTMTYYLRTSSSYRSDVSSIAQEIPSWRQNVNNVVDHNNIDFTMFYLDQQLSTLSVSPQQIQNYVLPSVYQEKSVAILDNMNINQIIDCPMNHEILQISDPLTSSADLNLPGISEISKEASNVMQKRRRKMNRHQFKKRQKRIRFLRRKIRQHRERVKRRRFEKQLDKIRFKGLFGREIRNAIKVRLTNWQMYQDYLKHMQESNKQQN
ncbi:uncharacterized protein LOC102802921 [Saccoglossus kowalevskii]|uniref:Uncharacterized protein LOC102802921 n=1 Tax=Saccoglossus kowalevskii TaxID=10224 RepID=A0ABM0MWA7_SACKO|nr:PREDICTED: uncharacterized protein LOC102802921 [Saccoglossus kowalevskii]